MATTSADAIVNGLIINKVPAGFTQTELNNIVSNAGENEIFFVEKDPQLTYQPSGTVSVSMTNPTQLVSSISHTAPSLTTTTYSFAKGTMSNHASYVDGETLKFYSTAGTLPSINTSSGTAASSFNGVASWSAGSTTGNKVTPTFSGSFTGKLGYVTVSYS